MKVTVKGFITVERKAWDKENPYRFDWYHKNMENFAKNDLGKTIVADYDIEIEAPDNLDELINTSRLTYLQHQRKLILSENQDKLNNIDRQISELLAIENKAD